MTWGEDTLLDILAKDKVGKLNHSPRLYETEIATAMGIPFDHRWYSIDKTAREQHIASRLARISIDNMQVKAMRRGK